MSDAEQIRLDLLKQFEVKKHKALESLAKVGHGTRLHNTWYRAVAHLDITDLTQSQREILNRFGGLYGLNQTEIDTVLTIATESSIIDIMNLDSTLIGLTSHCPHNFLFTDQKLTPYGCDLVDILVEAVSGDISQHGANAIMACIGFYPTPTQEGHINPVRDDFERYLSGKKGYMPGLDQMIIERNRSEEPKPIRTR